LIVRAFLSRRRKHIRSRVFNSRRGSYFLYTGDMEREAAKGFVFVLPALLAVMMQAHFLLVLVLLLPAILGVGYGLFALYTGIRAYSQRSDEIYDRHTRHGLPPEYKVTESATRAKKRQSKNQ